MFIQRNTRKYLLNLWYKPSGWGRPQFPASRSKVGAATVVGGCYIHKLQMVIPDAVAFTDDWSKV